MGLSGGGGAAHDLQLRLQLDSAVIGLSVKTVEAAQSGGFIWLFPLTFCSTAFVPLDQLPSWMQGFAEYQPVSVTVTAVRGLTMDSPIGNSAWLSLAWSVGILAVFVPLAVRTYRTVCGALTARHALTDAAPLTPRAAPPAQRVAPTSRRARRQVTVDCHEPC